MGDCNPPPSSYNPRPSKIKAENLRRAEQATREIIRRIQPTPSSEETRTKVIEYVKKLIRRHLAVEVLPFGSVPLKTYLPDGDIDLTALGVLNSIDDMAYKLRLALEAEVRNKDAEFEVKDVQYIHAEVRLIKCLVQNIVVDISFNQIGGLCTLCFLEQVDQQIRKNNLFKRSIILIKAWCYYESRVLGAHHGLISTYALETLVLYVFHLFHSSLDGPLAVLYRFLDYYSKFDFDHYCISLNGPIPISSLPELVVEKPENDGGDLLLSKEFLGNCVDKFSVRLLEKNPRRFQQKHLNIVDPLKANNNLGRSVSKGNLHRIRSAFTFGARKLGQVLLHPSESIAGEIDSFFMNTLDRQHNGGRLNPNSAVTDHEAIGSVPLESELEKNRNYINQNGGLYEEINSIKISGSVRVNETRMPCRYPSNQNLDANNLGNCSKVGLNGVMERNISRRDARDIATTRAGGLRTGNETRITSSPNNGTCASPSAKFHIAPHLLMHQEHNVSNGPWCRPTPAAGSVDEAGLETYLSEYPQLGELRLPRNERIGSVGNHHPNQLPDLSGDYELHYNSLLYAREFQVLVGTCLPVQHGTGTYFPNANYHAQRERQPLGSGRNAASEDSCKPAQLDVPKPSPMVLKDFSPAKVLSSQSGSSIPVPSRDSLLGVGKKSESSNHGSGTTITAPTVQKLAASSKPERPKPRYQLKSVDDFPPLTG